MAAPGQARRRSRTARRAIRRAPYHGTPTTCSAAGCHQKDDVHQGKLGTACEKCHVERRQAHVPAQPRRRVQDRRQAHAAAVRGLPQVRSSSSRSAPTASAVTPSRRSTRAATARRASVATTTTTFTDIKAQHDVGDFSLTGAHDQLDCARCHPNGEKLRGSGNLCITCHRKDDIHKNALSPRCGECHTQRSFAPARFDHMSTGCALTGLHSTLPCADCHKTGNYGAVSPMCVSCHRTDALRVKQPDHRRSVDCGNCHNPSAWIPATSSDNRRYADDAHRIPDRRCSRAAPVRAEDAVAVDTPRRRDAERSRSTPDLVERSSIASRATMRRRSSTRARRSRTRARCSATSAICGSSSPMVASTVDARVRQTTSQRFQSGAERRWRVRGPHARLSARLRAHRAHDRPAVHRQRSARPRSTASPSTRRLDASVGGVVFAATFPELGSRSLDTDYPRIRNDDGTDGALLVPFTGGLGVAYQTADLPRRSRRRGGLRRRRRCRTRPRKRPRACSRRRAATARRHRSPTIYHFALLDVAGQAGVTLTNGSVGVDAHPTATVQLSASVNHVSTDAAADRDAQPARRSRSVGDRRSSRTTSPCSGCSQDAARAGASLALAHQRFEVSVSGGVHRRPEVSVELADGSGAVAFPEARSADATFSVLDRRSLGGTRASLAASIGAPIGDERPERRARHDRARRGGPDVRRERGQLEVDVMAERFRTSARAGDVHDLARRVRVLRRRARRPRPQAGVLASWRIGARVAAARRRPGRLPRYDVDHGRSDDQLFPTSTHSPRS